MQHDHTLAGPAFRLRPVCEDDAAFMLELRCKPALSRYLHTTPPGVDAQRAWIARYYERPGDYYFVIERLRSGDAEGLISLYDIDAEQPRVGEWGRWILRPSSLAAIESAWLIYRFAFEEQRLRSVYCRTVANNAAVVSFHDSCGIAERRLLPSHFGFGDRQADAVEHRVDQKAWEALGPRLEALARSTARRVNRV